MNAKCLQTGSHSCKRIKKERLLENSPNKGVSDKNEGLGRGGEEGTKEKADERPVATRRARSRFVVEIMTGIRDSGDHRDLRSPSMLHPSQEICGNLIPFGLKSPDKTESLQLN